VDRKGQGIKGFLKDSGRLAQLHYILKKDSGWKKITTSALAAKQLLKAIHGRVLCCAKNSAYVTHSFNKGHWVAGKWSR